MARWEEEQGSTRTNCRKQEIAPRHSADRDRAAVTEMLNQARILRFTLQDAARLLADRCGLCRDYGAIIDAIHN